MKKYKQFIVGLVVGAMLFSIVPLSAAIEEFICYRADYKVIINGVEYVNPDLPILSYNGNTYAPLKNTLEKAGLNVTWNADLNQTEVTSSPTAAQINNVEVSNMSIATETIKYTPDGIEARLYNSKFTVSTGRFQLKYKDTAYKLTSIPGQSKFSLTKNGEVILSDVQLIEGTYFIDFDYYCNTILPLLSN